jgi:glutaredoxin
MRPLIVVGLLVASISASFGASAAAYRWVDPVSGRTVISDTPPPRLTREVSKTSDPSSNPEGYSYGARKAAENFPVTLYTLAECLAECTQAREQLNRRGVPFTEKILQSEDDRAVLKALVGDVFVPSLKVGRQHLRGFEASAYDNLLDLAGYPKTALPGSKPSGGLPPSGKEERR